MCQIGLVDDNLNDSYMYVDRSSVYINMHLLYNILNHVNLWMLYKILELYVLLSLNLYTVGYMDFTCSI